MEVGRTLSVEPISRTGAARLFVEPRRPEAIKRLPYAHWLVVATVCVGAFMGQLDASIVTQAFPIMQRYFHSSIVDVQWVGLAYLLVLVSLLAAVGRLADMVGRKLLYTYGFIIFIIGSALSGFAPSLSLLILARVLQGVGAAMLQANSVAIIVAATPGKKLGQAIGIQGAAQALGLALGPGVGGLLIGLGGWQLIFFVNVPVGIVGTALGWFLIPRSTHLDPRVTFDWTGLLIFIPSIVSLLLFISEGNRLGWLSPTILALLIAFLALGFLFIKRELKIDHPMIDLSLFKNVQFSAGIVSGLLSYLVLFGVLFVVPFLLVNSLQIPVARAGLELMVMPAGLGLVAPFSGRLADKVGAKPLTVAGMLITAAMLVVLAISHGNVGLFLLELGLVGVGLGLFTPPNNAAIMGAAPKNKSGLASGILNMTRGMGTSMGLALTGLVFDITIGKNLNIPRDVATGFDVACYFLGGIAIVAAILAALRGKTELNLDPVLLAE